jgi:hypothetical protein
MADTTTLYLCSWGDIRLFCSGVEWEDGETQVVHNLASGSIHPVQPRGGQLKRSTAKLMFDDFPGSNETGTDAYRRFRATTSERRVFTHPVIGSYFARIGDLKPELDESSVITATCEIIPDGESVPVSPAGAGTTGISGESSVASAADNVAAKLNDVGLGFPPSKLKNFDFSKSIEFNIGANFSLNVSGGVSVSANVSASGSASASGAASASLSASASATASAFAFASVYAAALATARTTAVAQASGMASANAFAFAYASAALDKDARVSVASWTQDEDVPNRKIMIDTARISDSIVTMIEQGGFEDDLQLFPQYQAAIMLGDSLRTAAVSATSETPTAFVVRVQTRTSLLSICAKIYGGTAAQQRSRQIALLNDIRTPGWLDPGDYLMPSRPTTGISPIVSR